eukprot:scaffold34254_cov65-Phaeocystis_antarctica.AAC.5
MRCHPVGTDVSELHLAQAVLGEAADRRAMLLAVHKVAQVGGTCEVRLVLQEQQRPEPPRCATAATAATATTDTIAATATTTAAATATTAATAATATTDTIAATATTTAAATATTATTVATAINRVVTGEHGCWCKLETVSPASSLRIVYRRLRHGGHVRQAQWAEHGSGGGGGVEAGRDEEPVVLQHEHQLRGHVRQSGLYRAAEAAVRRQRKHRHPPSTHLAARRAIAHAPDERLVGLCRLPREPPPFVLAGLSVGKLVAVAGDDQVAALNRAGAE